MKNLKAKWTKKGKEVDVFVHIKTISISKGKYPMGRGGGGGTEGKGASVPKDYGSTIEYYVSEDEEGKKIIGRGQSTIDFDIDGTESVQTFAVNTLKKNKTLKDMKEE